MISDGVLSALVVGALGVIGWLLIRVFDRAGTIEGLQDQSTAMDKRLTRIETAFEIMGHKMMGAFHSPHTPEIDALLERWQAKTITKEEITRLKDMSEEIEKDVNRPREERAMAAWVSTFCYHELKLESPKFSGHL